MLLRKAAPLAVAIAATLVSVAACGGDDEPAGSAAASSPGTAAKVDLASVCPNPIVFQSGWLPQPDRAWFYGLIGPDGESDPSTATYSGPAAADPNVTVEVRAGGPAKGFQDQGSLLYADTDVLMADQNLDAMIAQSKKLPAVAVFAPMEKHPQILMWGADAFQFEQLEDIRDAKVPVLVAENAIYADVLAGLGKLDPDQIDKSYDFSPSRFVGAQGKLTQQGFATSEPYLYEHTISAWGKPVGSMLLSDNGYPNYASVVTVRPEMVKDEGDCLKRLVPLLQQSVVDYIADPKPMNDTMDRLATDFNSPSPPDPKLDEFAVEQMTKLGIVANGADGALGAFDMERVAEMIDLTSPVFEAQKSRTYDPALAPEALATNEFIDKGIGLP